MTKSNKRRGTEHTGDVLRGSRIGISQLMTVTFGLSILCAVLAAVLRRMPKEQQFFGAVYILVMMAICLVVFVVLNTWRARVQKQAGRSHFITKAPMTSWFHVLGVASCVFVLAVMGFGLVLLARAEEIGIGWDLKTSFVRLYWIVLPGMFSGKYLITAFFWKIDPMSVDVRDNGVILGPFGFAPWENFHGFRWNQFSSDLMLLSDGGFTQWKVPVSQQESLERVLVEFIPKKVGF